MDACHVRRAMIKDGAFYGFENRSVACSAEADGREVASAVSVGEPGAVFGLLRRTLSGSLVTVTWFKDGADGAGM